MQRLLTIVGCLVMLAFGVQGQGRKQSANFSQQQQYFNPALTGFEGPVLKTLYRNQWTGFEDAPKTILASAELDMKSMKGGKGYQLGSQQSNSNYLEDVSARNALGLTLLHDRFGPSRETQVALNYGSGVRLSEKLSLRWGSGLTYSSYVLDGNSLTLDQENDPRYTRWLGQNNRTSKFDLNLGIALSAEKFYLGYSMQDITKGKLISFGEDFLEDHYTQRHYVQAGYRTSVSDRLGFTINSICQFDGNEAATVEGQLKAVYQNLFWAGGGYRTNQAYSLTAGVRLSQLSIHYAYETPVQDARYISKATNEIALSYTLKPLNVTKADKQVRVW